MKSETFPLPKKLINKIISLTRLQNLLVYMRWYGRDPIVSYAEPSRARSKDVVRRQRRHYLPFSTASFPRCCGCCFFGTAAAALRRLMFLEARAHGSQNKYAGSAVEHVVVLPTPRILCTGASSCDNLATGNLKKHKTCTRA